MTLLHPERLLPLAIACAAVAVIALASWLVARRRATRLLGAPRLVGRFGRDLALAAALAAIAAALLGPQLGFRTLRVPGSGADVVLLLDVSRSMDAADVPPSRLVRAKDLALSVLARLDGEDRAALAVFADRGVALAPLSPDLGAIAELAEAVDAELVEPRGSDLGEGVRAALEAFERGSERPRVVLAIADGEDADLRDAGAALARRANARVVTVAIGTDAGAALAEGGEPVLDARRRPIVSRRDAGRLASLAEATGGASFATDRWGDVDLDALVAALRRDAAAASSGTVERRVPALRVLPLAALALLLLALEAMGARPREWRAFLAPRRAVAAAAAVLVVASLARASADDDAIAWLEARLRERPGDARLLTALGVARAETGRLDEAARALRAAALRAKDDGDAAIAYYDLGVLELRRERFEAAQAAFFDALALAPDDGEARFNLEWAVRAQAAQPPPGKRADEDSPDEAERPEPELPDPKAMPPPERAQPTPEPDARFAPELSPDRVDKWLDAVGDDPARGLRGAAGEGDGRRAASGGLARW